MRGAKTVGIRIIPKIAAMATQATLELPRAVSKKLPEKLLMTWFATPAITADIIAASISPKSVSSIIRLSLLVNGISFRATESGNPTIITAIRRILTMPRKYVISQAISSIIQIAIVGIPAVMTVAQVTPVPAVAVFHRFCIATPKYEVGLG